MRHQQGWKNIEKGVDDDPDGALTKRRKLNSNMASVSKQICVSIKQDGVKIKTGKTEFEHGHYRNDG